MREITIGADLHRESPEFVCTVHALLALDVKTSVLLKFTKVHAPLLRTSCCCVMYALTTFFKHSLLK